jgi:hypothetical protein
MTSLESYDELDAITEELEAVIRKLPVLPDKQKYVPRAAQLLATIPFIKQVQGVRHPPRGDRAAIRELGVLAKHLMTADSKLADLCEEADGALAEEPLRPQISFDRGKVSFGTVLAGLIEQTEAARARLEAKPRKKGGGRQPKSREGAAAARALGCYEALTGKLGGVSTDPYTEQRGGPFFRFLSDVFRVLHIQASVESQAKQVVKARPLGGDGFQQLLDAVKVPSTA